MSDEANARYSHLQVEAALVGKQLAAFSTRGHASGDDALDSSISARLRSGH